MVASPLTPLRLTGGDTLSSDTGTTGRTWYLPGQTRMSFPRPPPPPPPPKKQKNKSIFPGLLSFSKTPNLSPLSVMPHLYGEKRTGSQITEAHLFTDDVLRIWMVPEDELDMQPRFCRWKKGHAVLCPQLARLSHSAGESSCSLRTQGRALRRGILSPLRPRCQEKRRHQCLF